MEFLIILTIFTLLIYFIPSMVANSRQHKNLQSIIVLNLFLGWTLVGWVVSLVWAYSDTPAKEAVPIATAAPNDMRVCPYCAEPIRAAAIKCKHCGSDVSPAPEADITPAIDAEESLPPIAMSRNDE